VRQEVVAVESQVAAQPAMLVQPRQKCGPESVARADGVHDSHRWSRNSDLGISADAKGALRAQGHDHQLGAASEQATCGGHPVDPGKQPGDVGDAGFRDAALGDDAVEAGAIADLDKFGAAWRVGARTGAGDRCNQAGKFQCCAELVALEPQIPGQAAMVVQPCQERRPKGIAGTDRIDDLDDRSRNSDLEVRIHADGAFGSQGHDDQLGAASHQGTGGRQAFLLRKQPCNVGIAGFEDGALRNDPIQP